MVTRVRTPGRTDSERGFTIAELAVVIAILAILVGIAVPVLMVSKRKADHVVAVDNLMIASRLLDNVWYEKLLPQPMPDGDCYRDYRPTEELKGTSFYESFNYYPVDARYMSTHQIRMGWVELAVGGESEPIASAEPGAWTQVEGHGFRIAGIWKGGRLIASGDEISTDWDRMHGRVGVVENKYYWDGGWHENSGNEYITLITVETVAQLAHFYTMRVGCTVSAGTFDWKDGAGDPGEAWADETSSEKPVVAEADEPGDGEPADSGGDDPSTPGGDPSDPPPSTPEDPPDTTPEDPPATAPEDPYGPGVNQFGSLKVNPKSLNLGSNGSFMVTITLKSGYHPENVDPSSIRCYGAAAYDVQYVGNGSLKMKFNRQDLVGVPVGDSVQFVITGNYNDGKSLWGWDYIKVLDN